MMEGLDFVAPLFVPGDRPERFAKAAASGADAVIVDLEDAVAPGRKELARAMARSDFTSLPVILRINGVSTPWCRQDLATAAELSFAAIMVPKAELESFDDLAALDMRAPVIALIETGRGLVEVRQIAALPFVARLAFGSVDYSADIGCEHTNEALLSARSELVLASRLALKSAPLDGVTTQIDDAEKVTKDARYGRSLGFGGKLCTHPNQIRPVMASYRPTEDEISWARSVLASGDGAVALDGAMVDEPVRIRARAILAKISDEP